MTLAFLYMLASLDGILCGIRTGAGRCPLIQARRFYMRCMLRGFTVVQVASVAALGLLLIAICTSQDRALLIADLNDAARKMILVFTAYAALVLFNLALRLAPSVDIRSATSVLALGPLTAFRPVIMAAGTLYGIWASKLMITKLLGGFVLALMLGSEWFLDRMHSRIQQRELENLVPAPQGQF